jgi:hypothetical protein
VCVWSALLHEVIPRVQIKVVRASKQQCSNVCAREIKILLQIFPPTYFEFCSKLGCFEFDSEKIDNLLVMLMLLIIYIFDYPEMVKLWKFSIQQNLKFFSEFDYINTICSKLKTTETTSVWCLLLRNFRND